LKNATERDTLELKYRLKDFLSLVENCGNSQVIFLVLLIRRITDRSETDAGRGTYSMPSYTVLHYSVLQSNHHNLTVQKSE